MDSNKLQSFKKRPAFKVYPPSEDPLPLRIRKIRDKWSRLGVNLPKVWQIIRKGRTLYEENALERKWQINHKNRNSMNVKLTARPSEGVEGGYDIFPSRSKKFPLQVSLSLKKTKGRPAGVVGVVSYFIVRILMHAQLPSKRSPKANQFYWVEILKLLTYFFPLGRNRLTTNDLRSAYYYHLDSGSIPAEWPKLKVILSSPQKK